MPVGGLHPAETDRRGSAIRLRIARQTAPGKPVEAKGKRRPGRDNGDCEERSGENRAARHEDDRFQNERVLFDHVHASKNAPRVRRGQAIRIGGGALGQRKRQTCKSCLAALESFSDSLKERFCPVLPSGECESMRQEPRGAMKIVLGIVVHCSLEVWNRCLRVTQEQRADAARFTCTSDSSSRMRLRRKNPRNDWPPISRVSGSASTRR